jgi:hypothetical protein
MGHAARIGERRYATRILVEISEWKRSKERRSRRWKNVIKMNPKKVWQKSVTGLTWLRIETGGGLL